MSNSTPTSSYGMMKKSLEQLGTVVFLANITPTGKYSICSGLISATD